MSFFDFLQTYFAVLKECKREYRRKVNARMRELLEAYRLQG